MDSSDVIKLLILTLLIFLSAYFSSAETALTTANKIRIRGLAEEGDKRAVILLRILDDSGKMLTAILIGNNIVNLSASALITSLAIKLFGNYAVGFATGILTLIILIFGEISPKTYATIEAEKIALKDARTIDLLMKLMTPVIFIINKLSLWFLFLLKVDPNSKMDAITENELRTILEVSQEDGVLEEEEHQMINNVVDFGDAMAKDVMIPRIDMTCLDVNSSHQEVLNIFRENHHTRLPVYEETTDNVIGILNMKDILLYDPKTPFNIRDFMRKAYYTYEYKNTSELFLKMRQSSFNIIIVLDEYGATAGMITLEDLLEEIVGEIRDEYDEQEENAFVKINDLEYIVDGSLKLDDISEELELELESEDYDSIGGYIIELLDRLPMQGESVTDDSGLKLVVDELDKKRISRVHIYLPNPTKEEL